MNRRKGIALTLSVVFHLLIILMGSALFTEAFSKESSHSNIITLSLRSNLIQSPKDARGKDIEKSSSVGKVSDTVESDLSEKVSKGDLSRDNTNTYDDKNITHARSKVDSVKNDRSELNNKSSEVPETEIRNKITENKVEEVRTVDKRAIYNTQDKISDSGAILELQGWIWDNTPSPDDDTDEVGKIIFEIEIDCHGEVVSIRTLKRTVSLKLVSIYRASLENVTFSRTMDNHDIDNENNSIGKVIFNIKYK